MGVIVGEKATRLFEDAKKEKLPVVMFVASGYAAMIRTRYKQSIKC